MFSLVVLNGSAAGKTLRFDGEASALTIGRLPSCSLQLDDHRASRLHARIWHHAGQWHIRDCGSLNGTYVNARPIHQAALEPGDLIRIAERLILFADDSEEPGGAPPRPALSKSTTLVERPSETGSPASQADQERAGSASRASPDAATIRRPVGRDPGGEIEGGVRLLGSSRAMQRVLEQIARVGPTRSTVLIVGQSGVGKELVARSIHELSPYRSGSYVAVNCAAFSESLLESELFGHERGAFTGADRLRVGQFERAHRGTIFLDEVGEMSPACQAKLLRVLEGHPFQRLGGQVSIQVQTRMIAATHLDLEELVRQGRFREDLYYRLRVIEICVPPLRQRGDDAVELASVFLDEFRRQIGRGPLRLSPEAVEAIRRYPWPGNVRELKNAIERAVVIGRSGELPSADLGLATREIAETPAPQLLTLREAERRHIEHVMRHVAGNKTRACHILQIGRSTLYKKLAR